MVFPQKCFDIRLDPDIHNPGRLSRLLRPFHPDETTAYLVSALVNSVKNDSPKLVDPLPPTEERSRLFSRDSSPWSEFTGPLHSPADLRVSPEVLGFVRAMPAAFHSSNVPPKPMARREKRLMCRPFDWRGHCVIAAFFTVPATPEGLAYAAHAAAGGLCSGCRMGKRRGCRVGFLL